MESITKAFYEKPYDETLKMMYVSTKPEYLIKKYISCINRIAKVFKIQSPTPTLQEIVIIGPEKIIVALSDYSVSVQRWAISLISQILKALNIMEPLKTRYYKYCNILNDEFDHERGLNLIKDPDRWMDWINICKAFYNLDTSTKMNCMYKLIIGLYTRLDVVMRVDFGEVRYRRGDEDIEGNQIFYEDGMYKMIISEYKTAKQYGDVIVHIEDEALADVLNIWFQQYNRCSIWLLPSLSKYDKPLGSKQLGVYISDAFEAAVGKRINNQILRQSYETFLSESKEYKKMNFNEKKKAHEKLQHGFNIAQTYVKKTQ